MNATTQDPWAAWQAHVGETPAPSPREVVLPVRPHDEAAKLRPEKFLKWLQDGRRLSPETIDAFGPYVHARRFQATPETEGQAVVFPYVFRGELVNRAWRHPTRDALIEYEGAALPTLFNVDAIDAADPQVIVWSQRELDVLALHEAGYPQSVCLPQLPRPQDLAEGQEDRRFLALHTHDEMLARAGTIILALDATDEGHEIREELARRLGRQRCKLVTWPEGCVSAGDTLARAGKDALFAAVADAEPYPIQGVQAVRDNTLLDLRRRPAPATMSTGVGSADKAFRIPAEGRVIIFTGIPGHGKSSAVRFIMVHQMEHHDRKWAVFSPEMEPWQEFVASCAEVFQRKMFWPDPNLPLVPAMSEDEIRQATHWFKRRLWMLVADAEDVAPTLDWWLDKVRLLVLQHGITDALIDPWNELDHARGGLTGAEYLSRSLQRLNAFSRRYGVNVWIVNHPHSLKPLRPGEKVQPPGIYDMDGGAAWANKGSLIVTVHHDADSNLTQLLVRKAKFRRLGKRGNMAEVAYDVPTGVYSSPVT